VSDDNLDINVVQSDAKVFFGTFYAGQHSKTDEVQLFLGCRYDNPKRCELTRLGMLFGPFTA